MGANISYKLKTSLQGALAGGGDPATSPLYVFGPFLGLIMGAGVASVTFGASIWMAVFTVVAVSATYRYVMLWITDGSGGSGLSEEEFGGWAVMANSAITVIEYTLTFLVSISALVTFLFDRLPSLDISLGFTDSRVLIAVGFSVLVAIAVNRGPSISSKVFGPATAAILLFLWLMVGAVIWQRGFSLPGFDVEAFSPDYLGFTLGGFARILALMTGIEIFANLVASYEGNAAKRGRLAFGSLVMVMGTTVTTMVIVGPAILALADPTDQSKSVFTQTMDAILPSWLSYTGTLIGIAVLLSAAAASAQGLQNLCLGLRARHYIPAKWGQRNRFDVPSIPSWIMAFVVIVSFFLWGTHEETYLALYAAGVFILLSMTGWAAFKRFFRQFSSNRKAVNAFGVAVTFFSATCGSFATGVIFYERFLEGAWAYLVMVPALYIGFSYFRRRLGAPPEAIDSRLSSVINGRVIGPSKANADTAYKIRKILVPMGGKVSSDIAFYSAIRIGAKFGAGVVPAHVIDSERQGSHRSKRYLDELTRQWSDDFVDLELLFAQGNPQVELLNICESGDFDLICMASRGLGSISRHISPTLAQRLIFTTTPPVLVFRPSDNWVSRSTSFSRILVPLDGSAVAEQVLPYVHAWANAYGSQVTLLAVPEIQGEPELAKKLEQYLEGLRSRTFGSDSGVKCIVAGSGPARTILREAEEGEADLIVLASHGRGGLDRQAFVKIGSVSESVLASSDIPVLFISAKKMPSS